MYLKCFVSVITVTNGLRLNWTQSHKYFIFFFCEFTLKTDGNGKTKLETE